MDQVDPGNRYTTPTMRIKRKRGRPRKDQSLLHRGSVSAPLGFAKVNGTQHCCTNAVADANDDMVGQAVAGVVEAAFDAGYLLTVKIGNSNTSLRGVVFKPGYYVPISAENDVAPHVQMIKRNEIPFPTETGYGFHHQSRERNETNHLLNGLPLVNQVPKLASQSPDPVLTKGKHGTPVSTHVVSDLSLRGNVVPVVLEPINNLNGLSMVNQISPVPFQARHTGSSNQKRVTPEEMQNDDGSSHQGPVEVLFGEEVKSMKPSTTDDVTRGAQVTSQSSAAHIGDSVAAGKSSAEDSGLSPDGESDSVSESLVIEPMRVKPFENKSIGRMSELLQAVQQNMMESQVPIVAESRNTDQRDVEALEAKTQA
ncbi:hypothetical protein NMG60_11002225 [Bertholletia excelsa]